MLRPKSISGLFLLLATGCLADSPVLAQTQSGYPSLLPATNCFILKTEIRAGETVGNEQVKRAYITVGTNILVFRLPFGLQLDGSNPEKILITNPEEGWFIALRWLKSTQSEAPELSLETCKDLASATFPRSTMEREFSEFALNRSGPAFDLCRTLAGQRQSARIAYIPLSQGILEFSLVTGSEKFVAAKTELFIILASLKSDEDGPIRIEPLPDYS